MPKKTPRNCKKSREIVIMAQENRRNVGALGCIREMKVSYYDIKMYEWKSGEVCCMIVGIVVDLDAKKKRRIRS